MIEKGEECNPFEVGRDWRVFWPNLGSTSPCPA